MDSFNRKSQINPSKSRSMSALPAFMKETGVIGIMYLKNVIYQLYQNNIQKPLSLKYQTVWKTKELAIKMI